MTDLSPLDAMALQALEVRTTCTAVIGKTERELSVYWLDLAAVLEDGSGQVVDPDTGERHNLTWDPDAGYAGKKAR